jgi:putative sterol carrier protein
MASLEDVTNKLKGMVSEDTGLGNTLKFDLGDDGAVYLDATQTPNVVTNDDKDAACTVKISSDDFSALLEGDLDPMAAFSLGKLQVDGDMSVAMKLGNVLGK